MGSTCTHHYPHGLGVCLEGRGFESHASTFPDFFCRGICCTGVNSCCLSLIATLLVGKLFLLSCFMLGNFSTKNIWKQLQVNIYDKFKQSTIDISSLLYHVGTPFKLPYRDVLPAWAKRATRHMNDPLQNAKFGT